MSWMKMKLYHSLIPLACLAMVAHGISFPDEISSPDTSTIIHYPSASLSIAGDLKDVKLKSSIAQLVRALQTPSSHPRFPEESSRDEPKLVTKSSANSNVHDPNSRKLYYGQNVPESIVVSSQPISINSNNSKPKKSRNLEVDEDGVRTIEGVRVPDDEQDKHYTWRNARVIKGFLVPNDKPANPHKKRQVLVHTDPKAYYAAAAAAQAQGAPAIIESSALPQSQKPIYAAYAAPEIQSRYQAQTQQPVQSGLTTAFTHAQQGQQMYVLRDSTNGNTYLSPVPQLVSQVSHSQSQLSQRSGQPETGNNQNQNLQQQIAQAKAWEQAIQLLQSQNPQVQVHSEVAAAQSGNQIPATNQQQFQAQASAPQVVVQTPNPNVFAQRTAQVQVGPQQKSGFVIKQHSYVGGPGGQTFSIPVPIPADQVHQQQRHDPHQQNSKSHPKKHSYFAEKVMEALHLNPKAMEKVDANTAVVPALASTGIFLGLSALAAGWYLSKGNREVGIVRRTGRPRFRRDATTAVNAYPQEVDQATFFQSIIQQSLEKTQQQYESQPEVHSAPEPVYTHSKKNHRAQNRQDNDDYYEKPGKGPYAQEKSGALTVASSKNFAKVFVPAVILGLSVISITALIFGWYITGANREIAFLEPSSYQRKKRSLSTALADGWLQRAITAIHKNPYDRIPPPTSKSLLPHPFMDQETSKTSDLEFKISNSGLTGVLAGGALIAVIALGLASTFSGETGRQLKNPSSFPVHNQNAKLIKHLRAPRDLSWNDLEAEVDSSPNDPGFLSSILSVIEEDGAALIKSINDIGFLDPKSPCAKKLVCQILSDEEDDTVRTTEKRVMSFLEWLPNSVSTSLKEALGEIVSAVNKRDCSAFACNSQASSR